MCIHPQIYSLDEDEHTKAVTEAEQVTTRDRSQERFGSLIRKSLSDRDVEHIERIVMENPILECANPRSVEGIKLPTSKSQVIQETQKHSLPITVYIECNREIEGAMYRLTFYNLHTILNLTKLPLSISYYRNVFCGEMIDKREVTLAHLPDGSSKVHIAGRFRYLLLIKFLIF